MRTFFVGAHQPSDARYLGPVMINVQRLLTRRSRFTAEEWMLDSGGFSELRLHGHYRDAVEVYAGHVNRLYRLGGMVAAVSQDYMCEDEMLKRTGLTIAEHQRLTIERYDALRPLVQAYVLPVLQGYAPEDYVRHAEAYGTRLGSHAWVGVGSVCKRNANPAAVYAVLSAIAAARPHWRLHGFGVKVTALEVDAIRRLLYTSDSQAWSLAARNEGRDANDWREALVYSARIKALIVGDQLRGLA